MKFGKQKCVYPYKYVKSFERFYTDKFPDRREFHSSLTNGSINEKDGSISEKINISVKKIIYMLPVFGMNLK